MIYLIIGISIALLGMVAGHFLTIFAWQRKADTLLDNSKRLYPREFEIWRQGYRRGLHDIFQSPHDD